MRISFGKKSFEVNIRKFLILSFSVLILIFIAYNYENKVNYVRFVDEEENITGGKFLAEGQKLYSDIFVQHQPIAYILSDGIQKTTNPTSLFQLIKRHREFIIAWSFIWAIFLIWRFGYRILPAVISYEFSKIFLLGNLFLAESIVVYPLIYLCSLALSAEKIKKLEFLFAGLITGFIIFTLSPVWPLTAGITAIYLIRRRKIDKFEILIYVLGFLIVLGLVSLFISWKDYIQTALIFNAKVFIPLSSDQLSLTTIPKSFLSFITVFSAILEKTPLLFIIRGLSTLFIIGIFILATLKRWKEIVTIILLLGLANIRYTTPGLDYYRGFHLQTWFAMLVIFIVYMYYLISTKTKNRYIFPVIGVIVISISIYYAKSTLLVKRDVLNDYYINYSSVVDVGKVISILKQPGDTLFEVPDWMILYWQGDIEHFSKYIFFYPYMSKIPQIIDSLRIQFNDNQPTFFYCRCQDSNEIKHLLTNYVPVMRGGQSIDLYILKDRAHLSTKEQKDFFDYYRFSF